MAVMKLEIFCLAAKEMSSYSQSFYCRFLNIEFANCMVKNMVKL